ncbi:hypothetical protein K435DRAFT_786595 [Dendrothele bispora CBS 962.96]|uniref:NAD(P)-binding domain-containing protein n=1 Tax=Dendrothele bispora (strain CBS 962.96) TaxID=1314807 RepID=A0A4V4HB19_DENBC|nr:hypothetical protein K435DRAFT_786595 [Dendrothele bispora CBS 962.96]
MSGKSALIVGATGQTGQYLLKELLASSHYSRVGEYGRRLTDLQTLSAGKEKLEQKQVDFEKLGESGMKDGKWDVVFITLGTTKKNAGSAEAFEKIDREYVLNAAREAKSSDPAHEQRLLYCSSGGANSRSPFLYPKSKGLTEEGLASLGYSDTIIFRPGMLAGTQRPESRPLESAAATLTGFIGRFTDSIEIKVADLGKAMGIAGHLGSASLPSEAKSTKENLAGKEVTVIGNAGALALARSNK